MHSFTIEKTDPLYPTPLRLFKIDKITELNKKLIAEVRAWRKQEKGANISNQGDSWHSPNGLMTRSDPLFSEIFRIIPQIAVKYAVQINPDLNIRNFRFGAIA